MHASPPHWSAVIRDAWHDRAGVARAAFVLVVLLVATVSLRERWAQIAGLVAALAVVWWSRRGARAHDWPPGSLRPLHGVALGFVVVAIVHAVRLERADDLHALDGPIRFLLLAPLVYLPVLARLRWHELVALLIPAGILFGLTAAYGAFQPTLPGGRRAFGLFTYYNLYGYASASLLALLLWNAGAVRRGPAWWLAVAGAAAALVVSGTRGAWLPMPLVLVAALWRLRGHPRALRIAMGGLVALLVATALAWPWLKVRIHEAQAQAHSVVGAPGEDMNNSLGLRMAMWKISLAMIEDRPLTGQGFAAFPEAMQPWADRLGLNVSFGPYHGGFRNPHQQYLGWAATQGVPVALLLAWLCFGAPVRAAWRRRDLRTDWSSVALFVMMTMVFCLTESVVERQRGAAWYVIWVSLLLGTLLRESLAVTAGPSPAPVGQAPASHASAARA